MSFRRVIATSAAVAALLVPSMLSGLDGGRLLRRSAVAAESTAVARAAAVRPDAAPPADTVDDADAIAAADTVPVLPGVSAFGYGAITGFYPSDSPRELILTFDDGPDLKFTPIVLDELDRRGLKAIFFVTGRRVIGDRPEDLARRELLRKIAARGHLVGNHTMTHVNLCQAPDEAAAEIDANAEVIAAATGVRPPVFRAPYGARCHTLEAALADRRLASVGWNLDPQDWRNPTSEDILRYLEAKLSHLEGRGVLILHDTHPASVFALGPLFDWIARENQRAVIAGRPPIVLRDYSVFLPNRSVPVTGIEAAVRGVVAQLWAPWASAAVARR